jgi:hypothetical protein
MIVQAISKRYGRLFLEGMTFHNALGEPVFYWLDVYVAGELVWHGETPQELAFLCEPEKETEA